MIIELICESVKIMRSEIQNKLAGLYLYLLAVESNSGIYIRGVCSIKVAFMDSFSEAVNCLWADVTLFLSVSVCKRLHSCLNIMSLVAVEKRKSGKIGKIEIKWVEK